MRHFIKTAALAFAATATAVSAQPSHNTRVNPNNTGTSSASAVAHSPASSIDVTTIQRPFIHPIEFGQTNTILGCANGAAMQAISIKYLPSQFSKDQKIGLGCGVSATSLFTGRLTLQREGVLDCKTYTVKPDMPSEDGVSAAAQYYASKDLCDNAAKATQRYLQLYKPQ